MSKHIKRTVEDIPRVLNNYFNKQIKDIRFDTIKQIVKRAKQTRASTTISTEAKQFLLNKLWDGLIEVCK